MKSLYLIGYEKKEIETFIKELEDTNITTVIDVRERALSRKPGFSKSKLSKTLNTKGIKYYHFPVLGSPSSMRKELRDSSDFLNFFTSYRKYISNHKHVIEKVIKLVLNNGKSSALMCYEKNSDLCHRTIIASEILKKSNQIQVTPS